jgi:PKD domain
MAQSSSDLTQPNSDAIRASLQPANTRSWTQPVHLGAVGDFSAVGAVALNARGDAIAVWETASELSPLAQADYENDLRPGGPILEQLTTPITTRVGVRTHFSVHAHPWGSPIQRVRWDFGDGVSAIGQRTSHRYRHRGRYNLTITASDATGANTTATRTIIVTKRNR